MKFKNTKLLIFVPARKGSKGIKKKNFINLNGYPLIHYTLDLCKKLNLLDQTLVSSDDRDILKYSKKEGFNIDYKRPNILSKDRTSMYDTLVDGLSFFEKNNNCNVENILLLQPTSPLRLLKDVKNGINYYFKNNIESLASIRQVYEHPAEIIETKNKNKWRYIISDENMLKLRQSYSKNYFFIDGSFYLISKKYLLKYKKFIIKDKTHMFKISQKFNVDIDDVNDMKIAQAFMKGN